MKDRFEAKLILFIIPALAIWEVLYQLVIIRFVARRARELGNSRLLRELNPDLRDENSLQIQTNDVHVHLFPQP